ncbi:ATP-binding cassette domain-containing protein [Streptomyces sp. NPDC005526]|uniref:ABC transporter ATP-binding protein n=1 Tax=Streptomyces sp. NPDC005526 TaxID=3156885 RepID=UPI0033BB4706
MIQAFGLTSNSRKGLPPAVDDVSFEARAGRVTALLGTPGAGKTTTLRLMLELQQGRGITYFKGRPLHRIAHPSHEVGVLLGDVPGHPSRTVRGHLRMLCAAAGLPVRRADEVLEVVGLVSLREERLGTLSRGMDRRLGLACALLSDPHTLVLDDPAAGLSPREARWFHGMLRAHATQGGTVLYTTADSKEAARTADRVVTLAGGSLVADQEAADFARTRLRPRVAVRSPHATRLAAALTKEARTARHSVEVVREEGNRLSVYGSTCAVIGETAFRHGILIHQLADEVGDMGPGAAAVPLDGAAASGEPRSALAPARTPTATGQRKVPVNVVRAPEQPAPRRSAAEAGTPVSEDASPAGTAPSGGEASPAPSDVASVAAHAEDASATAAAGAPVAAPAQSACSSAPLQDVSAADRSEHAPAVRRPAGPSTASHPAEAHSAGTPAVVRPQDSSAAAAPTQSPTPRRLGHSSAPGRPAGSSATATPAQSSTPRQPGNSSEPGRPAGSSATERAGNSSADGNPGRVSADSPATKRPAPPSAAVRPGSNGDHAPARSAGDAPTTREADPGASGAAAGQPSIPTPRPAEAVASALSTPLPPPIAVRPGPRPLRPLRYELRRAAGISTGFVIGAAALVASALTALVLGRLGHTPQPRLLVAWPQQFPLPPTALAAGLLGALSFGDEFRHPALAADRGSVPRRLGLLTAKLVVAAASGLLLAFLTVGCDAEMLYLVYGRELTQVPGDWLSPAASWGGLVVGCAWAGVLAAGLFRSTTAGLAAVLAVPVLAVPLVEKVSAGTTAGAAAGFPQRLRESFLLQWPFGGDRFVAAVAQVVAQPVGGALTLSLATLLCAYLLTTLRSRIG